jgi:NAD(P)-dependent dehydrogenase (short-subunit alcohol dehydrogenase family)
MDLGLQGKVALVTGAGLGNGRAIATALAAEGCIVVVNDLAPQTEEWKQYLVANVSAATEGSLANRVGAAVATREGENVPPGEATAIECRRLGVESVFLPANVMDYEEVTAMVNTVVARFGRLDILVNNVGGARNSSPDRTFAGSRPEDWDHTIKLNFGAMLNCSHAVLPQMVQQRAGAICSILSDSWKGSDYGLAVYGAAKAAISSMSRTLALEMGRHGIRVNCVSPGGTATETAQERQRQEKERVGDEAFQARQKGMLNAYALGRYRGELGRPEDIARMVVFLCSSACDWVTGQSISVSGGYHMHQ